VRLGDLGDLARRPILFEQAGRIGAEQRERHLPTQLVPEALELDRGCGIAFCPEERDHLAEHPHRAHALTARSDDEAADDFVEA
jgi:hypothetical protein